MVSYDWVIDRDSVMPAGTLTYSETDPILVVDWNPMGGCDNEFIIVELTVTGQGGGTQTISQSTGPIDLKSPWQPGQADLSTSVISTLMVESGGKTVNGSILFNGTRVDSVDNRAPVQRRWRGTPGVNTVEAYTTSRIEGAGFWRFDFSGAEHFVPGSLQVEQGQIASFDGHSIAFRLTATTGHRLRFTFDLQP